MEIFIGFILYMFTNGEILEFTPKESLSDCLKQRREIARNMGSGGPIYQCGQGKVQMKKFNNVWHPVNLLEQE